MHTLIKQYLLSVYADGTFRFTERQLTKRGPHGQFTGVPRKCATCPYRLAVEVAAKEVV